MGNQDSTTMADSTFDAATGARDDEVVEAVLRERAAHLPARDGAAESVVLARLAQALADTPEHVLQHLADAVRALCGADAVVVAVRDGADGSDGGTVRWCVVSGALAGHEGERWGLDECACGTVIRADGAVLLEQPADAYPSLRASGVPVAEFLGVPWHLHGAPPPPPPPPRGPPPEARPRPPPPEKKHPHTRRGAGR
ncbi:hypothetical protein ACCD01_31230, partial [Telluria sp. Tellsp99]